MIPTWRLHYKFYSFYGSQYQRKDITKVCKAIVKLSGMKSKGDYLMTVKNNWATACNFLAQWEGKNK